MNVGSLGVHAVADKLKQSAGLTIQTGPFICNIVSSIDSVAEGMHLLYGDFPLLEEAGFADFHVRVERPRNLRRWFRPQVLFHSDNHIPFTPLALDHALPMLEWGLNWCISSYSNQYLILHAAVIEKGGRAVIMPAPPGSGKSTLCAGLVNRGWRLLSDEMTLVSRKTGAIIPVPRPVSLKNRSIEVIRQYAPEVVISRASHDTAKGTVAHMKPPHSSLENAHVPARPAWIIFPRYVADAPPALVSRSKAQTFIEVAENAFNYSLLGAEGFRVLGELVDGCDCYRFSYSNLDDALEVFNALQIPPA